VVRILSPMAAALRTHGVSDRRSALSPPALTCGVSEGVVFVSSAADTADTRVTKQTCPEPAADTFQNALNDEDLNRRGRHLYDLLKVATCFISTRY